MLLLESIPQFLSDIGESEGGRAILGDPSLHKSVVDAIEATGTREKRRRRFTACLTLYLVLGLSLYRRLSIPNVLATLISGLRDVVPGLPYRPGSETSACEARYALGEAPLRALFEARAAVMCPPPSFHGYRVWAIDGVRFLVPDTKENEAAFGRPKPGRGNTAYPVVRTVALVDTYGHRVKGIDIDRCDASERNAVGPLIENLGDLDVVLLDRGFPSGDMFWLFLQRGVHFVSRITAMWKPHVVRILGPGDYLVKIARREPCPPKKPGAKPRKRTVYLVLRMLEYRVEGTVVRLITDLTQPTIPAIDIATLYHERWEAELVYDTLKNHFATGLHGSPDLCFRSKLPEGVRQEIYGMLVAYNFVREVIASAAEQHDLKPLDISFTDALNAIQLTIPRLAAVTSREQAQLMDRLRYDIAHHCRLRKRRARQYPRKVKIKMSDFGCKGPGDVQRKVDYRVTLVTPASGATPAT